MTLRVATRRSPLALWQAHHVSDLLTGIDPSLEVELVDIDTTADQRLDIPISELGGKGAFSKQVQRLVLEDRADIAVHSAKDLQAETPAGLVIAAFPARGDVHDALVGCRLADLPLGAVVASGSQRRRVQLAELRPDLRFIQLRGNIATRLGRLDTCDAMVMAHVALQRLALTPDVVDPLDTSTMIPQVGQGALAVECRLDDSATRALLAAIDDLASRITVTAEREFLAELGGDCDLPAGAHAELVTPPTDGMALDESAVVRVVGFLAAEGIPDSLDAEGAIMPTAIPAGPGIERASMAARADEFPGRSVARRLRVRLG